MICGGQECSMLKNQKKLVNLQQRDRLVLFIIFCFSYSSVAFAYLGPGIGGGIIAATIGIIVAIFAALFGLIWFPVKKLLKKRKEQQKQQQGKDY